VSIAFLDAYLKRRPAAPLGLGALGDVPATAQLVADP
jgi:hypothetical protein